MMVRHFPQNLGSDCPPLPLHTPNNMQKQTARYNLRFQRIEFLMHRGKGVVLMHDKGLQR